MNSPSRPDTPNSGRDSFQALEDCMRGPAKSYFKPSQSASDVKEDPQAKSVDLSSVSEEVLQNASGASIMFSSASAIMGNRNEREETPATPQSKAGAEAERESTRQPSKGELNLDRFHISEAAKQQILARVEKLSISDKMKQTYAEMLAEVEADPRHPEVRTGPADLKEEFRKWFGPPVARVARGWPPDPSRALFSVAARHRKK